jgi:hypothetical protein
MMQSPPEAFRSVSSIGVVEINDLMTTFGPVPISIVRRQIEIAQLGLSFYNNICSFIFFMIKLKLLHT